MKPSPTLQRIRKSLDKYNRVQCRGQKAECCGAIMMTEEEKSLIESFLRKKTGSTTPPSGRGDDGCEYLTKDGKCSVYEERPLVCRGFGTIKSMQGPCSGCTSSLQIREIPGMTAYMMSSMVPNEFSKRLFVNVGVDSLQDLASKMRQHG